MFLLPVCIAFVGVFVLTPGVRELARRHSLDASEDRKEPNDLPRPFGGGIVVLLAAVLSISSVAWVGSSQNAPTIHLPKELVPLALGTFMIAIVALLIDRYSLRGLQKLAAQMVAVGAVICGGVLIKDVSVFGSVIDLGLLAVPITGLWLLAAVNSLCLLDGEDGFAVIVGIMVSIALAGIAVIQGNPFSVIVSMSLAGALLGFLARNLSTGAILLGRAGSMFVGLVLGALTVQGAIKTPATLVLATPIALLTLPMLDISAAVVRRLLGGKRLTNGKRQHMHQVLRRKGMGPRAVLLCGALLGSITAVGALLTVTFDNQFWAMASVVTVIGILWGNDLFGCTESALIRSRLRLLANMLLPEAFRRKSAVKWDTRIGRRSSRVCRHLWLELRQFANEHQLSKVRLDLEPEYGGGAPVLWERRRHDSNDDAWQTRIPLGIDGHSVAQIEFTGALDGTQARQVLTPLGRLIESLDPHLRRLVAQRRVFAGATGGAASRATRAENIERQLNFDRTDIAGVKFDFLPSKEVLAVLDCWRQNGRQSYITLTNPHSVMLCQRDPAMRAATLRAGLTLPDGVGALLAAKMLGYGRRHRVSGPALMLELCDLGRELGYRHFFYGGAPGIADRLAVRLSASYPGLAVAGTYSPPFRELSSLEDQQAVDAINSSNPDIVWVGLGAPKQEKWMAEHASQIEATAMIGVGAAFDFHTGNVKWAPWIVRKAGMEWAYRLACEPRRLWRRNLDSPSFLLRVMKQLAARLIRRVRGKLAVPRVRSITWELAESNGSKLVESPHESAAVCYGPGVKSPNRRPVGVNR